jgi:hypothetical protein
MMMIRGLLIFYFIILFCGQAFAQVDTFTLAQIAQEMQKYPPRFEYGNQRVRIFESLDKIIDFTVADYCLSSDRSQRLKEIVAFYLKRVDQGLDALENTVVTEGVHVFKFYSSSIILKSAEGTVALDFAQGPIGNDYKQGSVGNEGEPETSDYFKTGFYLTPEQRDRLARLVDVYLITHPHQDHADYSLAKRMIEAGKPVIGPEQLKYKWEDLARGIIVPDYEAVQKFYPCEIFTQFGCQYSESRPAGESIRIAVPTYYLSRDVESIRYLVRIGGITFLQSAENHSEGYDWLEKATMLGWNVDVLMTAGAHQGYRSVMKFLEENKVNYFSLPIHEYEITHPNGGRRAAPFLKGNNRIAFDKKRLMALLWGEDFLLTRKMIDAK